MNLLKKTANVLFVVSVTAMVLSATVAVVVQFFSVLTLDGDLAKHMESVWFARSGQFGTAATLIAFVMPYVYGFKGGDS